MHGKCLGGNIVRDAQKITTQPPLSKKSVVRADECFFSIRDKHTACLLFLFLASLPVLGKVFVGRACQGSRVVGVDLACKLGKY